MSDHWSQIKKELCGSGCSTLHSWMLVGPEVTALCQRMSKSFILEKRNSQPHLENAGSICWIWGCSDAHRQNKLTIGSGSKTTIPKRPRSGAKGGPPRYTAVKWAEILAPLLMSSSFSSRRTAELAPEPRDTNTALESLSLQSQSKEIPWLKGPVAPEHWSW